VIFAIDVSKSMLAADAPPTRMDYAKDLIRQTMQQLPGHRIGIMPFAGEAFMMCPLTTDRGIALDVLRNINTQTVQTPGTNIPEVLRMSTESFENVGAGARTVVLITDGENHENDVRE